MKPRSVWHFCLPSLWRLDMTEAAWGCALGWGCTQERNMDAVAMGPWNRAGRRSQKERCWASLEGREMGDPESTAHSSPLTAQGRAIDSFWGNMTSLTLAVCCLPASLPSVLLGTSCPKSHKGTLTPHVAGPGQLRASCPGFPSPTAVSCFPTLPLPSWGPHPTPTCKPS